MPTDFTVGEATTLSAPFFMRFNELAVSGKKFDGLGMAYRRGIPTPALPARGLQEVFLPIHERSLEALTDSDERKALMARHAFGLSSTRVNLFFTRLTIDDPPALGAEACKTLLDLLSHPNNDILAVPTIDFDDALEISLPQRIAFNEEFVANFLQVNKETQDKRVAMTIPPFYGTYEPLLENLQAIYSKYGQDTAFLAIDMGAQRFQNIYDRMGPLHRVAKRNHKKGDYFVYAANLSPCKRSSDEQPAEDIIAMASGGINATGPKRGKPAPVKPVGDQSPLTKLPKLFSPDTFTYGKINKTLARPVANWVNRHAPGRIEDVTNLSSGHVHGYNTTRANDILASITELGTAGKSRQLETMFKQRAAMDHVKGIAPIAGNALKQSTLLG